MISPAESTATLDTEHPPELGFSAEPAATAATVESAATGYTRVLLFTLAGRLHCTRLGTVREIIAIQPTTSLPGAPGHVRGLINLRGTIVTVLDATMCEYGIPANDSNASILLVERGRRVAGVVVDEVHDIGLLDKDIPVDALLDLSAMVQMALA
jgi:chemotaxis signal transduction protein